MTHKLHVYTGDGKGKTTAAMGLALRCLGHGQRVLIAQFLKDGQSGELAALRTLPGAILLPSAPVEGFLFRMTPAQREAVAQAQRQQASALCEAIARERPAMIILDELAPAMQTGALDADSAMTLVDAALAVGEVVVTGRDAPQALLDRADYITHMRAVRHPYDSEGLSAREGIEW